MVHMQADLTKICQLLKYPPSFQQGLILLSSLENRAVCFDRLFADSSCSGPEYKLHLKGLILDVCQISLEYYENPYDGIVETILWTNEVCAIEILLTAPSDASHCQKLLHSIRSFEAIAPDDMASKFAIDLTVLSRLPALRSIVIDHFDCSFLSMLSNSASLQSLTLYTANAVELVDLPIHDLQVEYLNGLINVEKIGPNIKRVAIGKQHDENWSKLPKDTSCGIEVSYKELTQCRLSNCPPVFALNCNPRTLNALGGWKNFPLLSRFSLYDNRVASTADISEVLKTLPKTVLSLHVYSIQRYSLPDCTQIKELYLYLNGFTPSLEHLKNLEVLTLDMGSWFEPPLLRGKENAFPLLKDLTLSFASKTSLVSLRACPNLEILTLSSKYSQNFWDDFPSLPKLHTLCLKRNFTHFISLENFVPLPNLKQIIVPEEQDISLLPTHLKSLISTVSS